jgi:hypothetical protein
MAFTVHLKKVRELDLANSSHSGRPGYLSAASGLVRVKSTFYVVADDELHLGAFQLAGSAPGTLIQMLPGDLPDDPGDRKKMKPDFEALTLLPHHGKYPHGALLALGSGSRKRRRYGVLLPIDERGELSTPTVIDASPLYEMLQSDIDELNIEGAAIVGDRFTLLHRGNKSHSRNAIISFDLDAVLRSIGRDNTLAKVPILAIEHYDLGDINGVPLSFTDLAALPDGSIVFSAVAENTSDSYLDGPCTGAAVGVLDSDGKLQRLERLEQPFKIEGIHAEPAGGTINVWLVTDADDSAIPALLLTGSLA